MKKKKENHEHIQFFKLEKILPLIPGERGIRKTTLLFFRGEVHRVRIRSLKLRLFKKERICVECGREGNIFCVDKMLRDSNLQNNFPYYLNLYCHNPEKGENMILMTKDHILPKSMGGLNIMRNFQCMCEECNVKKQNILREEDIAKLNDGRKWCGKKSREQLRKEKIKITV